MTGSIEPIETAGNNAPVVNVTPTNINTLFGTATYEFNATVTDADGDDVSLTWYPGDGSEVHDTLSITRQFHAGEHVVTLVAQDAQGGRTAEVVEIDVPAPTWAPRSIGFQFKAKTNQQLMPSETAGVFPNSNWNSSCGQCK